jgi:hypothetical protein
MFRRSSRQVRALGTNHQRGLNRRIALGLTRGFRRNHRSHWKLAQYLQYGFLRDNEFRGNRHSVRVLRS